jgi:hypothetical protein
MIDGVGMPDAWQRGCGLLIVWNTYAEKTDR